MTKANELWDLDAERGLVGSVLIDGVIFNECTFVTPGAFHDRRHVTIWQAFEDLDKDGRAIDPLTVPDALERSGKLEQAGGASYLTQLVAAPPDSMNWRSYARIVAERAARIKFIAEKTAEVQRAHDLSKPFQLVDADRPRYIVHTAADALAPHAPVDWIVDGIIYKKSITVLFGDGGTKKTWSCMHLAACVAGGAPWGDYDVKQCRVLYVDEENGENEILDRAGRCLRGAMTDASANLRIISLAAFHLDNSIDEQLLTAEILKQSAELVIMDALADIMEGDENAKQEVQPVFNALRRIAEKTNAALLVIHHENKLHSHRGSTVIKDAPDIYLHIESDPDSPFINFKTEKNRKGKAIHWSMCATWSEDSFYLRSAEAQIKPKAMGAARMFVLNYLSDHPDAETQEIQEAAVNMKACTFDTARKEILAAQREGQIERSNTSTEKRAKYHLLPVTPLK